MNHRMSSTNGLILLMLVFFLLSCCCFGCIILIYTQTSRTNIVHEDPPFNEWSGFVDQLGTNSTLVGKDLEIKVQIRSDIKFKTFTEDIFHSNCIVDRSEVLCEKLWLEYNPVGNEFIILNIVTNTSESKIKEEFRSGDTFEVKNESITTFININGVRTSTEIISLINSSDEIVQFLVCVDSMKFCGIAYPDGNKTIDEYDKEDFWDALTEMLDRVNFTNSNQSEINEFEEILEETFFKSDNELKSFFLGNNKIELPVDWFAGLTLDLPDNLDRPNGYCGNLQTNYPNGCKVVRVEYFFNKNFHFIFSTPREYDMLRDNSKCHDSEIVDANFGGEKVDLTIVEEVNCNAGSFGQGEFFYVKGCRQDNICIWGAAKDLDLTLDFINDVRISD